MERALILVVDDDPFFRKFCSETLDRAGHEVQTATSGNDALRLCSEQPVALVVVDIYMPEKSGIEILEEIKTHHPSIDVVVTTGYASVDTAVQALKKGASDYLRKPFAPEELTASVGNILEQRHLYDINKELQNQLQLYELSRTFAAMEEPTRVAALGLDALIDITDANAGLCLVHSSESDELQISAERGVGLVEDGLAQGRLAQHEAEFLEGPSGVYPMAATRYGEVFGEIVTDGLDRALVVPLVVEGERKGAFTLFFRGGEDAFAPRMLHDAEFLGNQISLSYKSADRLQAAKGLAYVDSLTDLYNARYLPLILEKRLNDAQRQEQPLSLLFLDLDNFRDVNTAHGHQAGGKALIEVGWILESNVRGGDTVIRYGGDEFTIVLPNADNKSAMEIAERIRAAISDNVFLARDNKAVRLTACIGVSTFPEDATTPELLIHLADQAMYRGKETTRDAVHSASGDKDK